MNTLSWQRIDDCTERTRVPGGWLVRYREQNIGGLAVAMTFVPDVDNTWRL
jgi:hypothetical protein